MSYLTSLGSKFLTITTAFSGSGAKLNEDRLKTPQCADIQRQSALTPFCPTLPHSVMWRLGIDKTWFLGQVLG